MQKENVKPTENSTGKTQHLTGKDVLLDNISLGGTEQKTSGKFNYCMTQVLYNDKPFVILERVKMKIFSFNKKTFSVGLSIDEKNKDYFEKIEKRIPDLYDDLEIKLIKPTNDYLKIYAKLYSSNGKMGNGKMGKWENLYSISACGKRAKKELLTPKIIWVFHLLGGLF